MNTDEDATATMTAAPDQGSDHASGAGDTQTPAGAVRPEQVKVWQDAFQVLHVSVDGEEFHDVRPRRLFPLSGKADYVSFMAQSDKEAVLLVHPHKLDRESRKCLEKALGRMYYVARILRVDEITEVMGVSLWRVQTDRGYATFEVVDRQSHIRRIPPGRYLISDVDGNRFEIDDITRLDDRSQNLVAHET